MVQRGPFGPGGEWGGLYVAYFEGTEGPGLVSIYVKQVPCERIQARMRRLRLAEPTCSPR